ncbi:nose resistant to fluoxetine protein 6-like [Haematobia irritans]|uniref:nose resistant to fluoxetine protein 6-like n=1 Tax=Haematobia irritans TaxID=7368 RepID=UPI003F4FCC11
MAYEFCCLPIFRVLARLSFQMYLWHLLVLQITNGYQRQPHHMTQMNFNGQGMITIFLSIIVAFFACLLIEYPLGQLIDALMINLKQMPRNENATTIKIAKKYDTKKQEDGNWGPDSFLEIKLKPH